MLVVGSIILFPEQIFPALVGIFLLLIVLLLVVEVLLDVYIIVAIILKKDRDKEKK